MNGLQFNLLPDVKIEFIKTRAMRRMIVLIATVVSGVSLAIFVVLFLYVRVNQVHYMKALDKDITNGVNDIKATPDLDKILTIQNQLSSISGLHNSKFVSSRTIDYLGQLLPSQSSLTAIDIDFGASTIKLTGSAANLEAVNKIVDTMKFTDYNVNDSSKKTGKAFSNVVLTSFSVNQQSDQPAKAVNFSIEASFDPTIYANNAEKIEDPAIKPVTLTVPSKISSRSETEKPNVQFGQSSDNKTEQRR